jgi:hypothetical protein
MCNFLNFSKLNMMYIQVVSTRARVSGYQTSLYFLGNEEGRNACMFSERQMYWVIVMALSEHSYPAERL